MKNTILSMLALGLVNALLADAPQPFIHYKMDAIVDGVVTNYGTNTDARCNLTVGAGTCITNIQGLGNALFFDAVNAPTAAWGSSWSPGVRNRTFSFWMYRPSTDEGIDVVVNKAHYILNGWSAMNVMCAPGNGFVNVKVGDKESTSEQIAHTYFYNAIKSNRGYWHHMVVTLRDTGTVEEEDPNYLNCPIYELRTYLDGVLQTSVVRTLECDPKRDYVFKLGNASAGGVRPVPGAFSDVRFYDTVLTADEISGLFRERLEDLRGELVVWYPMESIDNTGSVPTTPEASGMGVGSAMELGSAVTTTTSPEGPGLQFDATSASWGNSTLDFAGLPLLDNTVTFWMYIPRGFANLCGALSKYMARVYVWGATRFMFNSNGEYADNSTQADLFLFNDSTHFSPMNCYLDKGCWVHVAISTETTCDWSSGTAAYSVKPTFYADGVKSYEGAWTATPGTARFSGANTLSLANNAKNGTRGLYGAISDFRIYRGALSSNEVAAVYRGTVKPEAGADFTVAREFAELHGNVASRTGEGYYGRAPSGTELSWKLVSAPVGGEGAAIETPNGGNTRVMLPAPGAYTFRLTATTMGAERSDEVTVTRIAASGDNAAPVVAIGSLPEITAGTPAAIAATVTDSDSGPGMLRGRWKLVSGAGGVWFADETAASPTATFSAPGSYTLRFTADDGQDAAFDEATVAVSGTAADPANTLTNGLIGYWPIGFGAMKDMVSGTAFTRDLANTTLDAGVDGNGFRGRGKTSSLITGCNMRENGTNGNRPILPEGQDTVYRSFSFWMYHDTATPNTNDTKCIVLLAVPYAMELIYNCEGGVAGNNSLFQMWQQNGKDTDGGAGPSGGGGNMYFGSPAVSPANRWMHVYVAFDRYRQSSAGNDSQLWIDGVKQTSTSGYMGYSRVKNDSVITFGGMNVNAVNDIYHSYNGYFTNSLGQTLSRTLHGWMDEIRMYDRLLDESEIKYLATHPVMAANRGPSVGMPNAVEQTRIAHKKPLALTATAAGDPLPTTPTLSYEWRVIGGDAANVTFADATARETTAVFARAGSYRVQLAVSDGERTTYSDPLTVEVPVAGMSVSFR